VGPPGHELPSYECELWNFLYIRSGNRRLHVVTLFAFIGPEVIIPLARFGRDLAVVHFPTFDMRSVGVGYPIVALHPGYPESAQTVLLFFRTTARQDAEEKQKHDTVHR